MPHMKRIKTKYSGVFYVQGMSVVLGKPERIYYIRYKNDGKGVEVKAGREFEDKMTAARAAKLRRHKIREARFSSSKEKIIDEKTDRPSQDGVAVGQTQRIRVTSKALVNREGNAGIVRLNKPENVPAELTKWSVNESVSLGARLQFEILISELSAKFINLPVDQINEEIENGQEKVCKALGLNRSLFLEYSTEKNLLITKHVWFGPGVSRENPSELTKEFAYLAKKFSKGEIVFFSDPDELPEEQARLKQYIRDIGETSGLGIPLEVGKNVIGVMSWESHGIRREWPKTLVDRLRLISEVFANALSRKRAEEALRKSIMEIKKLKDQLQADKLFLLDEIKLEHKHYKIVGESDSIKKLLGQIETVADTNSTVLIFGETGTGKEMVARAIHDSSSRKERPMVKVNCSALPATLIESELFGYEKGAFSGADSGKEGRFETANGSTIFLDEIGDLPLELQPKLLRVLQEGEFEKLGSSKTTTVDVRVIAATNRDLEKAVKEGRFRSDLYYRLNVYPINVPPLRERPEDIPILVRAFVQQFCESMGKTIDTIPARTLEELKRNHWPGNIRELRNLVEHAMIISNGNVLRIRPPETSELEPHGIDSMDELQRRHILQVLKKTGGRIYGDRGAAELLGMNADTLRSRMKRLRVSRMQYLT